MIDEIYAFRSLRSRAGRHKIEKEICITMSESGTEVDGGTIVI